MSEHKLTVSLVLVVYSVSFILGMVLGSIWL